MDSDIADLERRAETYIEAQNAAAMAERIASVELQAELKQTESLDANQYGFPGGVVGELALHILGEMRRPQPRFALCCALSIVSFLSENQYAIEGWGTRLNLYQIVIGYTGGGKDAVYSLFMEIIKIVTYRGDPKESCTSGAALQRLLSENPNVYLFKDEIWEMMESTKGNNANSHARELVSVLMSLYSKGGSIYGGKAYAKTDDNIEPIDNPFINFVGATTPVRFAQATSQAQVDDGFLNRMIVHRSEDVPEMAMPAGRNLNQQTLSQLRNMQNHGNTDNPTQVAISDDAAAEFLKLSKLADANLTNPEFGPLWSRAHENALRLAGVTAVGINYRAPLITHVIAKWACGMVTAQLEEFTKLLEEEMSESKFDEDTKRALKFIKKAKSYKDQRFADFFKLGVMPRSKLLKLMKMDAGSLNKIVEFLLQSEQIQRDLTGGIEWFLAND
jgi:hypothetical protein